MSIILQPGQQTTDNQDRLMKMNFKVTQHVVESYNRIWVSTRALELAGFAYDSIEATGKWMNDLFYKEYYLLRTVCIKDPDAVSKQDMIALMQAYCGYLTKSDIVQDYWITLHCPRIGETMDSKSMNL